MTQPRRENGETRPNLGDETAAARKILYPSTRLFTEGVTTDRLMQVVRVLPSLLLQREMPSEVIERHGSADGPVEHHGWPLMRRSIDLPGYHPELLGRGSIMTNVLSQTLFLSLSEDPGIGQSGIRLETCTTIQGRPEPTDQILTPDLLVGGDLLARAYDTEQNLSSVTDRMTTRSVGMAITYFAMNRNLLEDLSPFATADPLPDPNQP
jgi:hypothetical protein